MDHGDDRMVIRSLEQNIRGESGIFKNGINDLPDGRGFLCEDKRLFSEQSQITELFFQLEKLLVEGRSGDCNSKKWQNRACTSELGSKRCCPYRRRIRCS